MKTVEQIALEVANTITAPYISDGLAVRPIKARRLTRN